MKKRLTSDQEFQIMKLVLDKFLWLGFAVMAFGLYTMVAQPNGLTAGLTWIFVGIVVLVLFMVIIVKEYEVIK